MAKAKKEFKAGDRVIWFKPNGFDPREPVIAWVPQERLYPCVMGSRVRVIRDEKGALEGFGNLDSQDYVHPWNDDLWAECHRWMDRKAELYAELKKLQKGKF